MPVHYWLLKFFQKGDDADNFLANVSESYSRSIGMIEMFRTYEGDQQQTPPLLNRVRSLRVWILRFFIEQHEDAGLIRLRNVVAHSCQCMSCIRFVKCSSRIACIIWWR